MVKVEVPSGYKAVRIDYPNRQLYLGVDGQVFRGSSQFPAVILDYPGPGGQFDVECVAPEGWVAVDFRSPKAGEYLLIDNHEVVQCSLEVNYEWPIMVPTVEVTSIRGYLPLFIRLPQEDDMVWDHHDDEVIWGPLSFHELIVREEYSEPGGRKFQVPVHDVPAGYKPVAFRPPKAGELACHSNIEAEEVEPCQVQSYGIDHWLIVEKIDES